jgi:hypothetical protein
MKMCMFRKIKTILAPEVPMMLILAVASAMLHAQPDPKAPDTANRNLSENQQQAEKYQTDTVIELDKFFEEKNSEGESDEEQEESSFLPRKRFGINDTVPLRRLPDTVLNSLRSDKDFWYANRSFRSGRNREGMTLTEDFFDTRRTILWILTIGGFVAFIFWMLTDNRIGLFRKAPRRLDEGEEQPETDDIFKINYRREIDRAVSQQNYRLAIRLMYLQLLKHLADKNIIHYRQEHTNFDYLMQLNSTAYYHDFQRLTRHYEYSWYGQFEVPGSAFETIRSEFENFEQQIH